ncbi:MAG: hypothetical protein IT246_08025 [Bacteroidia bacterium]|nr:hypothetical protein [Bacteroidia bacterium]
MSVLLYIDPGSGSLFFQLLIAGIAGAAFTLKNQIKLLAFWIKSKFSKDKTEE